MGMNDLDKRERGTIFFAVLFLLLAVFMLFYVPNSWGKRYQQAKQRLAQKQQELQLAQLEKLEEEERVQRQEKMLAILNARDPRFDPDNLVREINLTDELILKHWNRLVTVFRPPYGVFSPQLFPALQSTSKKLVLWTSMAYDFKWDKGRILKHLYYVVHAGDIVVFHDAPQAEKVLLEVLPPFIQHCRRKGWGFGGIQ